MKAESKPLTVTESREGIERSEQEAREALKRGDQAEWMEAQKRRMWFAASLDQAQTLETEREQANRQAELDAKKPAALEAAKSATIEHVLAEDIARLRTAMDLLVQVDRGVRSKLGTLKQAQGTASRLCREARLPFVPLAVTEDLIRDHLNGEIVAALDAAKLEGSFDGQPIVPPIRVIPVKVWPPRVA